MPSKQRPPAPAATPAPKQESPGLIDQVGAWGNEALQSMLGFAKNPKEAIYQARLDVEGRQEGVLGDAHEISNQDIVLEQLAHAGAYGLLDNRKLAAWGYREAGMVEDPESGFRATLYQPDEDALAGPDGPAIRAIHGGAPPPVVAFRGTDNARGVADDVNSEGVGTYQFASNEGKVKAMLGAAGGKAIVTGHSLGGALAQLAGCRFPGGVSRIVTFQSPAIGADAAKSLQEHNDAAAPEDRVASTHHRAEGDLAHTAGEQLTEGDVFTFESVGIGHAMDHTDFILGRLAAARGGLVPGIDNLSGTTPRDALVDVERTTTEEEKSGWFPRFSESLRKSVGGLARDEDMAPYVQMWRDVQEMCESGSFSTEYVLDVVAASDRLTPEQKIKMRDQVVGLYG